VENQEVSEGPSNGKSSQRHSDDGGSTVRKQTRVDRHRISQCRVSIFSRVHEFVLCSGASKWAVRFGVWSKAGQVSVQIVDLLFEP
jgi:hypothetical protein